MEIGRYKGFYQFDDPKIIKLRGIEKTYFTLEITDFDGHKFSGCIEDDVLTGGMEGKGTVSGAIYSDGILFVKNMPYRGFLVKEANGIYALKMDKTRKHLPIHYDGIEVKDNGYKGAWNIKYGIWVSFVIWLFRMKAGGTWEMSKEK